MKTIIKITLIYIIACIVISPCLMMLNDNLWVNLGGFAYLGMLWTVGHTKVGKTGLKCLSDASDEIEEWLENK